MATSAPLAPPTATTRRLGETTSVVSAGPWFSAVTSAAFADAAREARQAGAREVVLDLTDVRAVDAAGTAALELLAEELEADGCEVVVATGHPGLLAWLQDEPLEVELTVHESVATALADLLRRPV